MARIFYFRQANVDKMQDNVSNIDRVQLLNCKNEKWDRFKGVILEAHDVIYPKGKESPLKKRSPQWMNKPYGQFDRQKTV
uniref:Uncharacterized protein n=1 Tax=Anguilla anguilla TaxID=7936 RepID=A0A0E9PU40_ANGAN